MVKSAHQPLMNPNNNLTPFFQEFQYQNRFKQYLQNLQQIQE